ncbi:MAG TPA: hypothetical protein VJB90_02675 [Candidatus Nanoarchaeia archaeon]|nr:hypothetical protein [Candidatus Nanoarchaeia archaeon]
MESLNELIDLYLRSNTSLFLSGLDIVTDFDPTMPKIYPDINHFERDALTSDIMHLIIELSGEQADAKMNDRSMTKLRYGTVFVDGIQYLVIDHDGNQIPADALTKLNRILSAIGAGEKISTLGRGGNYRAAYHLVDYGGSISIENTSGEYHVSTTVEIPLN